MKSPVEFKVMRIRHSRHEPINCKLSKIGMAGKPHVKNGFTLIELLVVIAVIGILAALLIPAVSYGKFKARVTTCTSNYRQLALAAAMYAGDDSKGRLPSFELPSESTKVVYPWTIGFPMLKAMEAHGIAQPQMWFCPLRDRWEKWTVTFRWKFGRPMGTIDDFTRFFTDTQQSKYGFLDLNWWVPRPLEGSPTLTYPDASLLTTRLKTRWPSQMSDTTISTRPILSDWITGSKATSGDSFSTASGAHAFGGKIRNVNSAYADGHVVTHSSPNLKWELEFTGGEHSYVFY
jgi:prepilin-type N-terminal cleavage/methylation domain-containing protein/prepilin-type processing-associated H-X9-DG protein